MTEVIVYDSVPVSRRSVKAVCSSGRDWAAMWKIWIWAQKHALQSNYTWWSSIIVRPKIQRMHVKWKRKNERSLLRWLRGSKREMLKFQHVKWINQWYSVRDCGLVSKNKGNESTWSQNYEIRFSPYIDSQTSCHTSSGWFSLRVGCLIKRRIKTRGKSWLKTVTPKPSVCHTASPNDPRRTERAQHTRRGVGGF